MKNNEKAERAILARLESETAARRAELEAAVAATSAAHREAQAVFERQTNPHHHFQAAAAEVQARRAARELETFDAAVAARATAEWRGLLEEYISAVAAAEYDGFIQSLESEFAECLRLERALREQVEQVAAKSRVRAEAARRAQDLANSLELSTSGTPLRDHHYTDGAKRELGKRLAAVRGPNTDPLRLADWLA